MPASLPLIAALVRAGAGERAWDLFSKAGWAAQDNDPAALSLKGRLLKDRARRTQGVERAELFAAAATAYAAAHQLAPAPYRAINVATARLLAGDPQASADGARKVLALLDGSDDLADTPYYLAATRAEALLLLRDRDGAEAALERAVAADPDGWEDRAVTLRQLGEILAARGEDADWLARFAPPASLHFAGHLGIAAGGAGEAALAVRVDQLLTEHRIGFAWGALAAGADIIIAERLVAAGVELHAVLPCPPAAFAAQSVDPAGPEWSARFAELLGQVASLRIAADCPAAVHDPLATAHAAILAIGATRLEARRLGANALQLLVEDEAGGGANTRHQAQLWPENAGQQVRVQIPRDVAVEALFPPETPDPARRLMAHLAVRLDLPSQEAGSVALAAMLAPVAEAIRAAELPVGSVRAAPGHWNILLDDLTATLALARHLIALPEPRPALGLHLAITKVLPDPASSALVPYGQEAGLAERLMAMAPAGTALVSDALAVSLVAAHDRPQTELYHLGDDDTAGAVHLLRSRDQ
jgi:hypothetical protein